MSYFNSSYPSPLILSFQILFTKMSDNSLDLPAEVDTTPYVNMVYTLDTNFNTNHAPIVPDVNGDEADDWVDGFFLPPVNLLLAVPAANEVGVAPVIEVVLAADEIEVDDAVEATVVIDVAPIRPQKRDSDDGYRTPPRTIRDEPPMLERPTNRIQPEPALLPVRLDAMFDEVDDTLRRSDRLRRRPNEGEGYEEQQ